MRKIETPEWVLIVLLFLVVLGAFGGYSYGHLDSYQAWSKIEHLQQDRDYWKLETRSAQEMQKYLQADLDAYKDRKKVGSYTYQTQSFVQGWNQQVAEPLNNLEINSTREKVKDPHDPYKERLKVWAFVGELDPNNERYHYKRVVFYDNSNWTRLDPYTEVKLSDGDMSVGCSFYYGSHWNYEDEPRIVYSEGFFTLTFRTSEEPFRSDMQRPQIGQRFL